MNLRELVSGWLKAHGFDGLCYGEDGDMSCGCEISDLMPCDEPNQACEPGRKGPCSDNEDYSYCEGKCDWHMYPVKEVTS